MVQNETVMTSEVCNGHKKAGHPVEYDNLRHKGGRLLL